MKNDQLASASPPPLNQAEIALILECLRLRADAETRNRLESIVRQGVRWERALRFAQWQSVMPALHWNLARFAALEAPAEARAEARESYFANRQRNLALVYHLGEILNAFERRGIAAIAWKGPLAAAELYPSLALRHIADLDLIVHKRDFDAAKALLCEFDYEERRAGAQSQPRRIMNRSEIDTDDFHCEFAHRTQPFDVELHWRLSPGHSDSGLAEEGLWARAERKRHGGLNYLALSASDSIKAFLYHAGGRHAWDNLRLFMDLSQLFRSNPKVDWAEIADFVRRSSCSDEMRTGVYIVRRWLQCRPPKELEALASDTDGLASAAAYALCHCLSGAPELSRERYALWRSLLEWPQVDRGKTRRGRGFGHAAEYARQALTPRFDDQRVCAKYLPGRWCNRKPLLRLVRLALIPYGALLHCLRNRRSASRR